MPHLQVCFFSATLHSTEITELADRICDKPTWVDLKGKSVACVVIVLRNSCTKCDKFSSISLVVCSGKDSVPESVHHVVVELDPESSESKAMLESDESKLLTTDDVHPTLPTDKKERGSELIKR